MAGFLQPSSFHSRIALCRIYTIALYTYYPIKVYQSYLIVSRPGPARLEVRRPRTPLQIS